MNFIPDDRAGVAQQEFHDEVIRDDAVRDCFTNSPFKISVAKRTLRVMLRDVEIGHNDWGNGDTFFLTEEEIEALFHVGPIFLRLVASWQHHQSHKALKLLKKLKYAMFMYKRLLPLPGLTFLYPAGLVRDWSAIIMRDFADVSVRRSAVRRLISSGPRAGSAHFQQRIESHFQHVIDR